MNDVQKYGTYVNDFTISPYESLDMLDLRSKIEIEKNKTLLTEEEISDLEKFDQILLNNRKKMFEHLSKVFNFQQSKENTPLREWWWHLDQK